MNGDLIPRKLVDATCTTLDLDDFVGTYKDVVEVIEHLGREFGTDIRFERETDHDGFDYYVVVKSRPETDIEYARRVASGMADHERRMEYLKLAADEVGMKLVPKD